MENRPLLGQNINETHCDRRTDQWTVVNFLAKKKFFLGTRYGRKKMDEKRGESERGKEDRIKGEERERVEED